jgi:hypothetical protein
LRNAVTDAAVRGLSFLMIFNSVLADAGDAAES